MRVHMQTAMGSCWKQFLHKVKGNIQFICRWVYIYIYIKNITFSTVFYLLPIIDLAENIQRWYEIDCVFSAIVMSAPGVEAMWNYCGTGFECEFNPHCQLYF